MSKKTKDIKKQLKEIESPIIGALAYTYTGGCKVIKNKERGFWHITIKHPSRNPTIEEICEITYALLPENARAMMLIPPKNVYIKNVYEFRIWEMPNKPDNNLIKVVKS